jgi:hypothetical protein
MKGIETCGKKIRAGTSPARIAAGDNELDNSQIMVTKRKIRAGTSPASTFNTLKYCLSNVVSLN